MRASLVLAAALLGAAAARAGAPSTADLRASAVAADAAVDNQFLKDGPGPAAALQRHWTAAHAWLAEWVRLHPAAPASAAAAALKAALAPRPDDGVDVSATPLDARSLLVTLTRGSLGDAFVLRRESDGRVITAWAVEAPGAAAVAAAPLIQASSPARAGGACREHRSRAESEACGPLTANAGVLAPEADGARRFYLSGVYGQDMGATGGQLVTVWRWDGREAQPLLARSFGFEADQSRPLVAVDGRGMRVNSKGEWRQLFACGACEGRQMTTPVRLPARGAAWDATVSHTPEVDAVDALYDRVAHDRPADDLAAPPVIAVVRAQVAQARASIKGTLKPSDVPTLSMLSIWRASGPTALRRLCLDTDDLGPQGFTLVRAGPGWRVTEVRALPQEACGKAGDAA